MPAPYYFDLCPVRLGFDPVSNPPGEELLVKDFEAVGQSPSMVDLFPTLEWVIVTPQSSKKLREGVERVAWWFKREQGYDQVQYAANEKPDPRDRVFAHVSHREADRPILGAAVFRWCQIQDAPDAHVLRWVNLHPFLRRTGKLSEVWSWWRELYGDFVVDTPLSPAMGAFLAARNECWRCGPVCRHVHPKCGAVGPG